MCRWGTTVLAALPLCVVAPGEISAGPLLDSAHRAAARFVVRKACAIAAALGEQAAEVHQRADLWAIGGALNALYPIPAVPIAAHLDNARPPAAALVGVQPVQFECFNNGYRRAVKARRIKAAWLGFAQGLAFLLVVLVNVND